MVVVVIATTGGIIAVPLGWVMLWTILHAAGKPPKTFGSRDNRLAPEIDQMAPLPELIV